MWFIDDYSHFILNNEWKRRKTFTLLQEEIINWNQEELDESFQLDSTR